MKNNWLTKILSPLLGLGLVLGLLVFLSNSRVSAQDAAATPAALPGNSQDPLPPFAVAFDPNEPLPDSLQSPQADTPLLTLGWTAVYSESTTDLAWGDYDNDGDLDLLVANGTTGPNRLFNNQNGTLTFVSGSSMGNLSCWTANENTVSISWYDYDRDGYLDISIGNDGGRNCYYHNEGANNTFSKDWTASTNQATSSIAWAGWYSAGSGFNTYMAVGNDGQISAIYLLDTGQLFPYTFPRAYNTKSLAWGDYDNDGDPDLAMGNFGQPTIIFRNDPPTPGTRIRMTPVYTITRDSDSSFLTNQVAWGDLDGDGYLDLALGNGSDSGRTDPDKVICSTGGATPTFFDCWTSNDTSSTADLAWGDYDGDGDLDLAATSQADLGVTRLYINAGGMLATQNGGTTFDDETLEGAALAWADVDADGDLELSLGYDGSLEPYPANLALYTNIGGSFTPLSLANSSNDTRGLAWGDMNNDGYLDLAVANSGSPVKVYRSDGAALVEAWAASQSYNTRSVAWGDYDRDGDLDLALGNGQGGSGAPNIIYRNINNTLTASTAYLVDPGANTTAVAWGDMNGDGTLDLLEANYENSQSNTIFWNIWNPLSSSYQFTQTLGFGAASDRSTSLAIGDFDQDYDLDILVGNDGQADRVYVNGGNGNFTTLSLPSPTGVCSTNKTRSVAWADWDGDGDLDIAEALDGCVRVLTSDDSGGSWTFTQVWSDSSNVLAPNSVAWGDFDGDGDPDLAAALTGQFGLKSRIYRNTGGSMALFWTTNLEQVARSLAVAWGDVDNDGDLDLAVGNDLTNSTPDYLYINTILGATTLANDPSSAYLIRPDEWDGQANGWHFSAGLVVGDPYIPLAYLLTDNQGDRAFRVQHQVSFDGGYHWQAAWEYQGGQSGVWNNVSTSRDGAYHIFWWDALNQLLAHQNTPFNPGGGVYVPFEKSIQEMDIAFRVVPWSHNEHGGPIQRPRYGSYTTLMRADMRPDWSDSAKVLAHEMPEAVHPGEQLHFTVEISQTDHGMPPGAYIIDELPPQLYMEDYGLAWAEYSSPYYSEITSTLTNITWTGAIEYDYHPAYPHIFRLHFSPYVVRPLPNGLNVTNCADIYDGLHAPFERCLTFEISSTPKTDESWKLVNGLTENIVFPGELLTYTIVLTNTGTDNAHNVIMTDVVPANTVWLNNLSVSGGYISYANGVVNWEGELNVFEPIYITYTVQVQNPLPGNTVLTNTFSLQNNIDPVWTATPVTTTIYAPDLRASSKEDLPDVVELDDPLFYTLVLRNDGAFAAQPAYLTDPIPEGSRYISGTFSITPTLGLTYGYDPDRDRIYWVGELPVGQVVTLTYGVEAGLPYGAADGIITNTAILSDTWGGPVTLVATTTVTLPNLSTSVKTASDEVVELGDLITYTVTLNNTGGFGPAVSAFDRLPAGTTFVPNSFSTTGGSGGYYDGAVLWDGSLASGALSSFRFAVVAGCPLDLQSLVITNVVRIESIAGVSLERLVLTYIEMPDIEATTITTDRTTAKPGDVIRYTITIPNYGVHGVISMIDNLPAELAWVSGQASTGSLTYNSAQRRVLWEGELDQGQQVVITLDLLVRDNLISNWIYNNFFISDECRDFLFQSPAISVIDPTVSYAVYLPVIFR